MWYPRHAQPRQKPGALREAKLRALGAQQQCEQKRQRNLQVRGGDPEAVDAWVCEALATLSAEAQARARDMKAGPLAAWSKLQQLPSACQVLSALVEDWQAREERVRDEVEEDLEPVRAGLERHWARAQERLAAAEKALPEVHADIARVVEDMEQMHEEDAAPGNDLELEREKQEDLRRACGELRLEMLAVAAEEQQVRFALKQDLEKKDAEEKTRHSTRQALAVSGAGFEAEAAARQREGDEAHAEASQWPPVAEAIRIYEDQLATARADLAAQNEALQVRRWRQVMGRVLSEELDWGFTMLFSIKMSGDPVGDAMLEKLGQRREYVDRAIFDMRVERRILTGELPYLRQQAVDLGPEIERQEQRWRDAERGREQAEADLVAARARWQAELEQLDTEQLRANTFAETLPELRGAVAEINAAHLEAAQSDLAFHAHHRAVQAAARKRQQVCDACERQLACALVLETEARALAQRVAARERQLQALENTLRAAHARLQEEREAQQAAARAQLKTEQARLAQDRRALAAAWTERKHVLGKAKATRAAADDLPAQYLGDLDQRIADLKVKAVKMKAFAEEQAARRKFAQKRLHDETLACEMFREGILHQQLQQHVLDSINETNWCTRRVERQVGRLAAVEEGRLDPAES